MTKIKGESINTLKYELNTSNISVYKIFVRYNTSMQEAEK